jgi:hypothetical protein
MEKEFGRQNFLFGILDRRVIVRKHGMISLMLDDSNCIVSISQQVKNAKIFITPINSNGASCLGSIFLLSEIYSIHYN